MYNVHIMCHVRKVWNIFISCCQKPKNPVTTLFRYSGINGVQSYNNSDSRKQVYKALIGTSDPVIDQCYEALSQPFMKSLPSEFRVKTHVLP